MRMPRRKTMAGALVTVTAAGCLIAAPFAGAWGNGQKLIKIESVCLPDGSGSTAITAGYPNTDTSPMTVTADLDGTQNTTQTVIQPGQTYSPTFALNSNYPGGEITFHLGWVGKSDTDTRSIDVPASSLTCAKPTSTTTTLVQTVVKFRTKIVVRNHKKIVVRYKIVRVGKPVHLAYTP